MRLNPANVASAFPDLRLPFAGNSLLLAESCVRPYWAASILALGPGNRLREVNMAKRQTSSKNFLAVAGTLLLSIGLLLLFANLDEVATQVRYCFTSTPSSIGAVIELGLAGMRAVQAYFFDRPTFQAGLHSILISFWPLILVMIGATLLQSAIGKRLADSRSAHFSVRE